MSLEWTAPAGTVTGYNVKRGAAEGGPFSQLAAGVNVSGTTFTDTTAELGNSYYYVVTARNGTCEGANSDAVNAVLLGPLPDVPVAQAATLASTTSFQANWQEADGAGSYRLDVSLESDFASFVAGYNDLTVNNTLRSVTGLTPGQTYYYRVRAHNLTGYSAYSSSITVVLPSSLVVTITDIPGSGGNGDVTWDSEPGVSYGLYYSDNGGTSWSLDETVTAGAGSTSATVSDPSAGSTRIYKVVVAGSGSPANLLHAWGVSKPTIKGSTMTLLSPPLESDLDFGVGGQLGAELAEVLEPGDKIQILTPGTTSFTTLELNGSGQWIGSVTTLNPGQGFFVEKASAGDVTVRMTGQVGNDGASQNTLKVGYNVIGLSEGKNLAASSAFESADPEENYNGELADQVILQNSDGSWRRLIRRPPGVWYDTTTRANTTLQLTPGQAYYYLRRAGDATVSF